MQAVRAVRALRKDMNVPQNRRTALYVRPGGAGRERLGSFGGEIHRETRGRRSLAVIAEKRPKSAPRSLRP